MANPLLNEKAFTKAVERTPDQAGWGSAEGKSTWNPPISDGQVSPYISAKAPGQTMTANGAMSATMFLMVLLVAAATFGWSQVTELESGQITIPSWVMGGLIVGLICAFGVMFKPNAARILAPVYAIAQGSVVGAISKMFLKTITPWVSREESRAATLLQDIRILAMWFSATREGEPRE